MAPPKKDNTAGGGGKLDGRGQNGEPLRKLACLSMELLTLVVYQVEAVSVQTQPYPTVVLETRELCSLGYQIRATALTEASRRPQAVAAGINLQRTRNVLD